MNTQRITTVLTAALTLALAAAASQAAVFVKYDGIDGEFKDANHDKWIDVLSVDWGAHKPGGGDTGQSRPSGDAVVEDVTLTIVFDKSTPKLAEMAILMEACATGKVFPRIVIDEVVTKDGKQVYIQYELKNVMITSFQLNDSGRDNAGPPTVVIGNNFEEIKVTYTEYDDGTKRDDFLLDNGESKSLDTDTPKAKKNKKNKKGKKSKKK